MGLPKSRFVLFHRLVLLPPLVLLTLTCLYTSSTLSPFSTTHHLSASQDVQCFSCQSSSFPSRSFLSLANFPASSYIRDVVLRQNILKVEDSSGEATTEPFSRRDANEVESENGPDEVDFHPDTSRRAKEEVAHLIADEQPWDGTLSRQTESFDKRPTQPEERQEEEEVVEEVQAREEPTRLSTSEETFTEDTKVEDFVSTAGDPLSQEKATKDSKVEDSVSTVNDDSPSNKKVTEEINVDDSVSKDTAASSEKKAEETVDSSGSKEDNADSSVPKKDNADISVAEDKNVESSGNAVDELSTSTKWNSEGKKEDGSSAVAVKRDVDSSVTEDKIVDSPVEVLEVSKAVEDEKSEVDRKEDVATSVPEDIDRSVSEDKVIDSSVEASGVSKAAEDEKSEVGRKEDVATSVSEDKKVDRIYVQVSEVLKEAEKKSEEIRKEDTVINSDPEDKNGNSPVDQVKELSTDIKENSEAGEEKEDVNISAIKEENGDGAVEVVGKKESSEDRKEDAQNRHLTSDDDNAGSDEYLDAPMEVTESSESTESFKSIESNVSTKEVVSEPIAQEQTPPALTPADVMRFGHDNMSQEHKAAGIAVQKLMDAITKSGLPLSTENGNSPPDESLDANFLLRGGALQGVAVPGERSCDGRHVFVYDLPSQFNVDLVGQCGTLLRWFNFCEYFMNEGMGTSVSTDEVDDSGRKVLVPDGSWFLTHQYALELIFHARLKHYSCLTTDANQADLFFVPYYAGLDVIRWHFQANVTNDQRDKLTYDLMTWLEGQESWSRNKGVDHVFILGKIGWDFRRYSDTGHWGSKLLRLPAMALPTKVLIERDPWHNNDIGVPHPTFFHPKDDGEIRLWLDHVEQSERRYLVSFAGMPRPNMLGNVRGHLIQQCLDHPDDCFLLRCMNTICLRPDSTMNLFLHSHFCMQPPGDSPTRRSVFDSLIGGCIPVLFDPYTAYYQYPWHLPQNESSYSVFIPSYDVMSGKSDIVEILKSISPEERTAMRTRIIREMIPGLLYSQAGTKHSDFRDAFDISIDALLHRVAHLRAEKQLQRSL